MKKYEYPCVILQKPRNGKKYLQVVLVYLNSQGKIQRKYFSVSSFNLLKYLKGTSGSKFLVCPQMWNPKLKEGRHKIVLDNKRYQKALDKQAERVCE